VNEQVTIMSTATLRKWGGAIAVSLPKKLLSMLSLEVGAEVNIVAENGKIILSPARQSLTLPQLMKEQKQLERRLGNQRHDRPWLDSKARGKELL
jgi:antitoxin component of MazEF toxin-antitoxin module